MKKWIAAWAAVVMTVACGIPPEETFEPKSRLELRAEAYEAWQRGDGTLEELDQAANGSIEVERLEMGELEQAYGAKVTSSYQFGVTSADARMQCGRTNSFQTCFIPTTKTYTFFIDPVSFGPPGTGFNDEIFKYVDGLRTALAPEWSFTEVFSDSPEPTMHFRNIACPGAFTSSSIAAFSCVDLDDAGVNLTEGSGVVGQYKKFDDCNVNIDMDDINARGTTTIQELRLLRHATGHASLACVGLGGRNDSGADGFASRMLVDVNFSPAVITAGEKCRAKSLSVSNNGAFNLITPECSGAN